MIIKLFGKKIFELVKKDISPVSEKPEQKTDQPQTSAFGAGGGAVRNSRVIWRYYDGEKTAGGMGPIKRYTVDHEALRMRSWQLLLESEVVQIGVKRSVTWGIGKGLKLRLQPDINVLKKEGIDINSAKAQQISKDAEGYWKIYVNNNMSSYSGMQSLQQIMWEAEKNAIAAGDCLFVVNVVDGMPKIQLYDGSFIRTPVFVKGMSILDMRNPDNNNRIRHGIEINERGEHIAFYVNRVNSIYNGFVDYMNYERIPAKDKYGNIRAFMYYGDRYRIDDLRGIPLIAVCMQTTKQLDDYKEATVEGAVERAKIAFTIEHEKGTTGINPFESNFSRGFGNPMGSTDIPRDINGQETADTFAATTGKQAVNMPVGASVKNLGVGQEVHFGEFYDTAMCIIFAALEIPKEVALMMFGSNYSASRAAIKDWEHTLEVRRETRIQKAYQTVFDIFFLCCILKNRVSAEGYLEAFQRKNFFAMYAYTSAKWIGDRVPNIDELKEVKATRELLPAGSEHMPLITLEDAIERHSNGEFVSVTSQYAEELQYADEQGIEKVEVNRETIEDFDDPKEDDKGKPGEKGNDKEPPSSKPKK